MVLAPVQVPQSKRCPRCGVVKPSSEFYVRSSLRHLLTSYCKVCKSDLEREARIKRRPPAPPSEYIDPNLYRGGYRIGDLPDRIACRIRINPRSGCWEWGRAGVKGYAVTDIDGERVLLHRLTYEMLVGPIPDGLFIDHVRARGCISTRCIWPAHLEPVTNRENTLRGDGITAICASKTHCIHGHEFTPKNTLLDDRGQRRCRTCKQARSRRKAVRTECVRGHPFTAENTYWTPDGHRECRTCRRERRKSEATTK